MANKTMKIFSSTEHVSGTTMQITESAIPTEPKLGMIHPIGGVPHYYGSQNGEPAIWIPLGQKRSNKTVNFPSASTEWIAQHNLSTMDLIIGVYDSNGEKIVPQKETIINADTLKLTFATPVAGKVVVFGASEKYAGFEPAVNALNEETVSVGTGEPSETTTSTLYVQVDP